MITELSTGFPYKPSTDCFGYSTSLLIKSKNNTILFDTGGYNIRKTISSLYNKVSCVVISHLHFDHCSNLDLFANTKTPIYISKKELEYYENNKDKDLDLFSYFDLIKMKLNIIAIDKEIFLDDTVKIIFTPGHTPGHISLSINNKNQKSICAGDSIKSYKDYCNKTYGNAFDKELFLKTKEMIKQNYDVIYPGHSSKILKGQKPKEMELIEF